VRALLDTNAFLWAMLDDARLSRRAREMIRDRGNTFCVSAGSAWEIVIKVHRGKLRLPDTPSQFVRDRIALFGFESLAIEMRHVLHVESLPDHHRDPFDRILAAQSLVEGLPVLTADEMFSRYGVEVIWQGWETDR
jgi:PIN domain nuclease of toxin-antitoxin system